MSSNEKDMPKGPDLCLEHELALLDKNDPETLRSFYSLTGSSRKEYTELIAEADSERVRRIGEARAAAHLAWMQAHADGLQKIGEALQGLDRPELAVELAKLDSLERVATSLANGKATKLFLPREFGGLMSLLTDALVKDSSQEGSSE